jgi:prepilin-type N-terminal cleavage/methylation domain-containing protein
MGTRPAFTLLEVLLALTIFALVTVGVLLTFRTATRTYERSERTMAAVQAVRALGDQLTRDIRATFLVTETNYGVRLPPSERQSRVVEVVGDWESDILQRHLEELEAQGIEYRVWRSDDDVTEEDRPDGRLEADLRFTVRDGGDRDSVSLVRRLRSMTSRRAQPWALVRLTYAVEGNRLVRREERAFQEELGITEENVAHLRAQAEEGIFEVSEFLGRLEEELLLGRETTATDQVFIDGVETFDVRCVHWADDAWVVSEDWDSGERRHRNSLKESPVEFGDPNFAVVTSMIENMPEDGLPAALEMLLGIREPHSGRVRHTRLVIPLHGAQETWTPPDPQLMEPSGARRVDRREAL